MGTGRGQLDADGLSIEVPGRTLLSRVDLEVRSGESVAIMGPSGSGKTSLLNCLSGIAKPTSGSVWVDGVEITRLRASQRSAFRLQWIGMVFQFGELLPELTVLENVSIPLRLLGIPRREAERRADDWLGRLDLVGSERKYPDALSGGEVQRVGIARALVHEPPLVLADEPTGALDEENAEHVAGILASAAGDFGAAVIIATHDPIVASVASRVLRLRDGRLVPSSILGERE
jgi:ABC-type lipoprotein export system ATPase subunit